MKTYLEINCHHIQLEQVGNEIVVKVKAALRGDLEGKHLRPLEFTNQEVLRQKNELYEAMFKSQIVIPSQPEPPKQQVESAPAQQQEKVNPETQDQNRSSVIFQQPQGNNSQNNSVSNPPLRNIFSRNPEERPQQGQGQGQSTVSQSLFGRRTSNQNQTSQSRPNTWGNNLFSSSSNNNNRDNMFSGSSSSPFTSGNSGGSVGGARTGLTSTNVFHNVAPQQVSQQQPSLFADSNSSVSNMNNSRRGRNKDNKTRIA